MSNGLTDERCLILVVLYRIAPMESETVRGLVSALLASDRLREAYPVLIWDNSPEQSTAVTAFEVECEYRHAASNHGIAGACNAAAALCEERDYRWMLVLDQDTQVTAAYLLGMLHHLAANDGDSRVAAIVPLLFEGDFLLSPQRVLRFRQQPVEPGPSRVLEGEVFAANSGVLLRVADLQAVGGYSLDFWLDHSDMYIFHQFHLRGKRIYLAADLRLQHSMTMLDYDARMTPERYDNFLHAEQAFIDLFKGPMQNAVQALRLLMRVMRQRRYRNRVFSRMTWRFLLWRLRASKATRLRRWKERSDARQQMAVSLPAQD
jgi:GT2 family glycosyltransferase